MDADLKRIVDTNYPEWDTLTVEEAVNAVGEIVRESSNPVVYRKQFNEFVQLKDEPIQEFVSYQVESLCNRLCIRVSL